MNCKMDNNDNGGGKEGYCCQSLSELDEKSEPVAWCVDGRLWGL